MRKRGPGTRADHARDDAGGRGGEAARRTPVTGPACTQNVECSFCHWFVPPDASACACPTCESVALGLEACGARMREFERVCAAFLREHACGPLSGCPPDDAVSTCLDGTCVRAPVVESTSGARSPCRSPADCPGGLRCVTASHGGPIGCTNEDCCNADECGNGCVTDADCPSCRPRCESGSCRSLGGAP